MYATNIAVKYNQFQNNFGNNYKDQDFDHLIDTLFKENYTKIANGHTLVSNRAELKSQFTQVCERWLVVGK